jgi:hypothetical protein
MSLILGLGLLLAGWAGCRIVAGTRGFCWLDPLPPLAVFAALLAVTDQPMLAGLLAALPLAGLAMADAAKREVLQEGVSFADGALLKLVWRHPSLYLPFAGTWRVVGGALAGLALLLFLAWAERPFGLGWQTRLMLMLAAALLFWPVAFPPALLRRHLSRDPGRDARELGPLATLALHRAVAVAERAGRRAAFPPRPPAFRTATPAPHILLIQAESFWDPRPHLPDMAPGLLPNWDRLAATSLGHGRLAVPGFGANTMRAEFAALTGIDTAGLGLDWLNPYFRFAERPVRSLPWTLRANGYRAAAVHPFDPGFFDRDRLFPVMGFQRFDALPAFRGAARVGRHVGDAAVADHLLKMLGERADPAFLFAITMQAHGPWDGEDPLASWAAHLRDTDAMLGRLASAQLDRPLMLAVYGDHLPALPQTASLQDRRTDWLLWRSDRPGTGGREDIAAHELFWLLGQALG